MSSITDRMVFSNSGYIEKGKAFLPSPSVGGRVECVRAFIFWDRAPFRARPPYPPVVQAVQR